MFIGHFGAGLAAKKLDRRTSLGTLFFAAQFIDLIWPLFLLMGIERVLVQPGISEFTPLSFIYYPFSHSMAAVIIWGLLFGLVYYLLKKNLKTSVILGVLVISHWILDLIVHIPDLPIAPGSDVKLGFSLWNSVSMTILFEGIIFMTGIYLYLKSTKAKNKTGKYAFWSLIIFLIVIYISNIFGPPPPDEKAIGIVGLAQWLIIAWGYWIDKNRISA